MSWYVIALIAIPMLLALPWLIDFCLWFGAAWVEKWEEITDCHFGDEIDVTELGSDATSFRAGLKGYQPRDDGQAGRPPGDE